MIQQILSFLLQSWRFLVCWAVLDQEQLGFVRRLGRPNRKMKPGWNWKWPVIEQAETGSDHKWLCVDIQPNRKEKS